MAASAQYKLGRKHGLKDALFLAEHLNKTAPRIIYASHLISMLHLRLDQLKKPKAHKVKCGNIGPTCDECPHKRPHKWTHKRHRCGGTGYCVAMAMKCPDSAPWSRRTWIR
jgi:hypothetical protein